MKVKCIENKDLIQVNASLLTIGKYYELLRTECDGESRLYWVIDDTGVVRFYNADRFEPSFSELRNMKIESILK